MISSDTIKVYHQQVMDITPMAGQPGDEIMITGQNLPVTFNDLVINFTDGENTLKVQEDEYDAVRSNEGELYFSVPGAAKRGEYTLDISLRGDSYVYTEKFLVTEQPEILRVTPEEGTSCDLISIGGNNFPTDEDELELYFGESQVEIGDIEYISSDSLVVMVPQGVSGTVKIKIISDGLEFIYDKDFTAKLGVAIKESQYTEVIELYNSAKADEVDVWVKLENDCSLDGDVVMQYQGITEDNNWQDGDVAQLSDYKYQVTLTETDFEIDPIGLRYYFEMVDLSGDTVNSGFQYIYKSWVEQDSSLADISQHIKFGTSLADYQVVSFPYEFDPNDVKVVLQSLPYEGGGTNVKKWRMYHWDGTSQQEFEYGQGGFTTIDPGLGYWMLLKEQQQIILSGGQTVNMNEGAGITLHPGWTQVGNPYMFDLDWNKVLEANTNTMDLEPLKTYDGGTWRESSVLKQYQGGFVKNNGTSDIILKIPYNSGTAGGGRLAEGPGQVLSQSRWITEIQLTAGHKQVDHQIGLSDQASDGIDYYDAHHVQ